MTTTERHPQLGAAYWAAFADGYADGVAAAAESDEPTGRHGQGRHSRED